MFSLRILLACFKSWSFCWPTTLESRLRAVNNSITELTRRCTIYEEIGLEMTSITPSSYARLMILVSVSPVIRKTGIWSTTPSLLSFFNTSIPPITGMTTSRRTAQNFCPHSSILLRHSFPFSAISMEWDAEKIFPNTSRFISSSSTIRIVLGITILCMNEYSIIIWKKMYKIFSDILSLVLSARRGTKYSQGCPCFLIWENINNFYNWFHFNIITRIVTCVNKNIEIKDCSCTNIAI